MKVSDLVKIKLLPGEHYRQRAMQREFPIGELGLVIEEAENAAKVLFPTSGKIRSFLKTSLEKVG